MIQQQYGYGFRRLRRFLPLLVLFFPCSSFGFELPAYSSPQFQVIVIAALMSAVVTFFYPKVGLTIMLLAMLFSSDVPVAAGAQKGYERSVSIRVEDLLLVLISGGWLVRCAVTRSLSTFKNVPVNHPIIWMCIVILLATTSGYLQGTTPAYRGFFFTLKRLEYFWLFFMTVNILDEDREAQFCIRLLIIAAFIVACIGVVQQILLPVSGGVTTTAGFGRANTLASFLLIMVGISLGIFVYSSGYRTVRYFILFLFFLATLIFTKSRGAYVSMVPLLVALVVLTRNPRLVGILAAGGMLVLVLATGTILLPGDMKILMGIHSEDLVTQFQSIREVAVEGVEADSSLNARVAFWRNSVPMMMAYPLLGRGVGAIHLGTADNQYVHEMLETGLLGLLCFLYMNLVILNTSYTLFKWSDNDYLKGLAVGFLCGHIGMLVHGLTISNFYTILNMEVFWFVTALIMLFQHQLTHAGRMEEYSYSGVPVRAVG